MRPLAAERGLELKADYGDLPRIFTDEDKLQQILINLLSNAVKFTDRGEIELAVEAAGRPGALCRPGYRRGHRPGGPALYL